MGILFYFIKKIVIAICIALVCFSSCCIPEDPVVSSLGEGENHVYFSSGGFQDYTDYAKYYYTSANVSENPYLKRIDEQNLAVIDRHLDDFEMWIDTIKGSEPSNEVVLNYDFDRTMIDTEDYIYIDSEEHTWSDGYTALVNYNIYFFDMQTQTLYFFHSNI